ncbi:MAG: HD domain-containing protein [Candidatus Helarchaeota archaeon]
MSREEALALLQKLGLPEHIIEHSIAVAKKALEIAKQIQEAGHKINLEIIEIGAILHDVGRIKTHGIKHSAEGGKKKREYGYPDAIARIAETHSLDDLWPETIEEKIVCYADKIVKGTQEMSVNDRFDIWMKRYGKSQILMDAKKIVLKIEEELFNLIAG